LALPGKKEGITMPHFPKPFYRAPRDRWYVEIDGKQINLGPDKDEAYRTYHQIMATRGQAAPPHQVSGERSPPVVAILDLFLEWCQKHRATRTYE
jgi:hypothetical protein